MIHFRSINPDQADGHPVFENEGITIDDMAYGFRKSADSEKSKRKKEKCAEQEHAASASAACKKTISHPPFSQGLRRRPFFSEQALPLFFPAPLQQAP